jgi:hypothetical protein
MTDVRPSVGRNSRRRISLAGCSYFPVVIYGGDGVELGRLSAGVAYPERGSRAAYHPLTWPRSRASNVYRDKAIFSVDVVVHQDQRISAAATRLSAVDHLAGGERRITASGSHFRLSQILPIPPPTRSLYTSSLSPG